MSKFRWRGRFTTSRSGYARSTFLVTICVMLWLIPCCETGYAQRFREKVRASAKPVYPGTVRVVFPGERKQVVVANPRNLGDKAFVFTDGHRVGAQEGEATPAGAKLVVRYYVNVLQIVELKDGQLVSPVMRVKYPRKGGLFRGVYLAGAWSHELQTVAPNEAPDDGWAFFPESNEIQKVFLLLKDGVDPVWRVAERDPEDLGKAKTLKIPDLRTLTLLDKHPIGKKLWEIHEQAAKEEKRLRGLE